MATKTKSKKWTIDYLIGRCEALDSLDLEADAMTEARNDLAWSLLTAIAFGETFDDDVFNLCRVMCNMEVIQ